MPIVGLKLSPFYSRESWILKENEQLDNHEQISEPERYYLKNLHDITHYSWTLEKSTQRKSHDLPSKSDIFGGISQEDRNNIGKVLVKNVGKWKSSSISSSLEVNRMQSLLLKSITRSILFHLIGNIGGYKLRGAHGYLLISAQEAQLYRWCLRLCKSAFWVYHNPEFDNSSPIYNIRFSDYLSPSKGICWWYVDGNYLGSCCCNTCVYICKRLKEHHSNSSNIIIEDIVCQENKLLLQFLKHNRKWPTLEHKLLSITLDGFLAQRNIIKQCISVKKSADNISHMFKNNGIFVICEDFDIFVEGCNLENTANIGSLLLDLIVEYTELWNRLNLPIFLFILYQNKELKTFNRTPNLDGNSNLFMNQPISFISRIPYVEFCYHLTSGFLVDEETIHRYLEDLSNLIEDLGGDSVLKKGNNRNSSISANLMKMVQGYTVEEFKVLFRHVKCEIFKIISSRQHTNIGMYGLSWIQNMLQKAISLRPPIHLLCHMPPTYRIYHKLSFTMTDEILPLDIDDLGNVQYKQGLSRIVLDDDTYYKVISFLDQTMDTNTSHGLIIEGSPGTGKTTLAMAMAWELGGIFIIANILDFIRPQVGFSEKLIHNFFCSIQRQFNNYSQYGTRRDSTQCTVLIEGFDTLTNVEAGYIKRTISAICMEMDSFAANSRFLSNHSTLFICTVNNASDIPNKLRTSGRFDRTLTLDNFPDASLLRKCLELYLNARCDCMDKIDEIVTKITGHEHKNVFNPAFVTRLCKEAAYYNIKTLGDQSKPTITISNMFNVIDSTLYKI